MSKSYGTFDVDINEKTGIATLCINNYKRRNAISFEMMEQLSEAIDKLEEWKTGKAVIMYGKNAFFSSGADLDFVRTNMKSKEAGIAYSTIMHSNLTRLQSLPMLTIAAISGQAIGGGAEILTAFDMRIMTRSAKLGFVQIMVGVSTGWSGGSRLVHNLGYIKALDLLMSGSVLMANEANNLGFVNHIIDDMNDEQLLQEVIDYLEPYLQYDKQFVTLFKSQLRDNYLHFS